MKKQLITLGIVALANVADAQNTLPTNGNVGIGTTNPSMRLEVASSSNNYDGIIVSQSNNLFMSNLFLNHTGTTGKNWCLSSTYAGDFLIGPYMGNPVMWVKGATGNVGIGSFWPLTKLDVSASNSANDGISFTQSGSGNACLNLNCSGGKNWSLMSGNTGDLSMNDVSTGNTTRFFVQGSTGNIGIGNTVPAQKLDVTGNIKFTGAFMPNNISGAAGQVLQSAGVGQPPVWVSLGTISGGTSNYLTKWGSPSALAVSQVYDNGTNVGIGTSSPSSKLSVNGDAYVFGRMAINCLPNTFNRDLNIFNYNTASAIVMSGGQYESNIVVGNSLSAYKFYIDNTNEYIGHIGNGVPLGSGQMNFLSFRQTGTGQNIQAQVWVGNSRPSGSNYDFRLGVDGKLVAKEIVITQQGWSDYVFENDYDLMPLQEVEAFYKNHHHLPDVPAATEVVEKGNNLGETDSVLLRKIEELTLYIVELEKRVQKIEK